MEIVTYLIGAVILITAGVIIANIVLESSAMRRLSALIRPFCHASNLSKEGTLSIFVSFFSPTAGMATLAGFYREGKIRDTETILTMVMSTFPKVAGESLFRVHSPIALVLLGPFVGGIHIILSLLSAFLQSVAAFAYAKVRFPLQTHVDEEVYDDPAKTSASVNQILKTALKNSFATLKLIIPIMVAAFLVIHLFFTLNVMDSIGVLFDPILWLLNLPGVAITALVANLAHFSAGYVIVAALMAEGVITAKQAILTLLIGSMMVITMIYLRYSLPMYISLFGRLGVKMAIINYLCSMSAKIVMILLVLILM